MSALAVCHLLRRSYTSTAVTAVAAAAAAARHCAYPSLAAATTRTPSNVHGLRTVLCTFSISSAVATMPKRTRKEPSGSDLLTASASAADGKGETAPKTKTPKQSKAADAGTGTSSGGKKKATSTSTTTAAAAAAAATTQHTAVMGEKKADGCFRMISWNVNGIRALLEKRPHMIKELLAAEQPDVLFVQETKVENSKAPKGWFKTNAGFAHEYWCGCSPLVKKGYSGIATFTKQKPLSYREGIGASDCDTEGRVCTLEFPKFYVVNTYVPNAGAKLVRLDYRLKKWDAKFHRYLVALDKKKPVILTGDLNVAHHRIDIARPDGNKRSAGFTVEERASFTKLLEDGDFVDSFRAANPNAVAYTYFSTRTNGRAKNIGWRLDYWVMSRRLYDAGVVKRNVVLRQQLGSDHVPISIDVDILAAVPV